MTINFRFKLILIFMLIILFLFACNNQHIQTNYNSSIDNVLIYVKNGKYTINDNGKEYTMCKCYMDDVMGNADNNYLKNGIYYKDKETIFIVLSDSETKNNYLYRIYRKGDKLKYDKIDESNLAINILYIHNELLYYKIGGSYLSWHHDDNHIIKTASVDGEITVVCNDVEGTFIDYACEIDTAIIKQDKYTVFGYKNNENIEIERNIKNGIVLITPYGCYYNSKTKNGIYYFDGEAHLLISGKTAYDILVSNDYKNVYIITQEENNQFNLYLYKNDKCSLIKENMEKIMLGENQYKPKLTYNYDRLFYNDKEVRIKSYLNTNDVHIYDRSTETYGEVVLRDYFSKYYSNFYNDLENNLYTYYYDDERNNPSLYKIVNANEKELITDGFDGFYKIIKCENNDDGNSFYLPELDKKYSISKVATTSKIPILYDTPYEELKYNDDISHSKNYYMPYIVEKIVDEKGKKEYKQYIAFDIDDKLIESNILYDNGTYDDVPLCFDSIYDKYYYSNCIYNNGDKWNINIFEITIDESKINKEIICQVTNDIESCEMFYYIGALSDYKIFISTTGIIYALDKGKLVKIGVGSLSKNQTAFNPYEKTLYYLKNGKDLTLIDENLNETEIAKNVLEFRVLKNEVIYTTDNREYEVYKYLDEKSHLLMKGRAKLYGEHNNDFCYIKYIENIRNKDFFTFDDNKADNFMKAIWDKWKNEIQKTKFQGDYNLFLYEKGHLKKVTNSYTGNDIVEINDESGDTDKYYAYMEYDLSFIPRSFNDLFTLLKKEYEIKNDEDFDIAFKNYIYDSDTKLYVNFINKLEVFNFLISDDVKYKDIYPEIIINVKEGNIAVKNNKNKTIIKASSENLNDADLILPYIKFTKDELSEIKKNYESVKSARIVIRKNY